MHDVSAFRTAAGPARPQEGDEATSAVHSAWRFGRLVLRREWVFRTLIVLATWVFLHVFPKLLFVVYMGTHGFFDYAFFREGPFAFAVFYGTAELSMVLSSLMMFGVILPIWARARHGRWEAIQLLFFGGLNFIVLLAVGSALLRSNGASVVDGLVFMGLGLLIANHIAVLVHESARRAFASLMVLFLMTGAMVAISPSSMARLLDLGLRVYRVGGDVPVALRVQGQAEREGRLIFLGPTQVFIQFHGEATPRIIERGRDLEIRYLPAPAPA